MFDSAHPPGRSEFSLTHTSELFPPFFILCVIVMNTIGKKEKKILSLSVLF